MDAGTFVRRSRSRLLFSVVATVALGLNASSVGRVIPTQDRAVAPQIEGTWLVTVTPAGGVPPPFPSLVTYSSGGGMIVTDSSFPPQFGNVYQGTWTRRGLEIRFTFLGLQFDASGVHSGYVRVSEEVHLDQSGEVYEGVATFEILDLNFNVLFSEPNFTHAVRVDAP